MSKISLEFTKWLRQLEQKWQKNWSTDKIFEANPTPGKPKYFITVAYPYVNSPQHIGHGRTYGMTDTYARFKRMQGYNVLYPQGFHYTGTPILAMAKRIIEGDERLISDFETAYHVPKKTIPEFRDPLKLARYFHNEIRSGMKAMGFSIDWRREFTTIDSVYNKFIEWQFRKLQEKGWLVKGSHPVGWCPNCGNAVGMHDTLHDKEPDIGEVTLIKIPFAGKIIPAATYRPETIFGLTNMFVNPNVVYKLVIVEGEEWILSSEAIIKLRHLGWEITEQDDGDILGSDLIGKFVNHPLSGEKLPILPASFVDPGYGTGIVMSVPAHAPFDLIALSDLENSTSDLKLKEIIKAIEPIPLIKVKGYGDIPAQDALTQFKITNQLDPAVEKATEEVYSREFHTGVMMENTGPYTGLTVAEAKEKVHNDLVEQNIAKLIYEMTNRPVYCRCGTECLVHMVLDQWFIDYGNPDWKEVAFRGLKNLTLIPEKLRTEFERVFDWLNRKACARKSGLGTPLPFDPDWIIESLSDSTIYMAYYCLAHTINQYDLTGDEFSDAIFDYIFLGIGNGMIKKATNSKRLTTKMLDEMRKDFTYYYPLDSRNSGRDLVPNHLSFCLFNHVAIFPEEHWPQQIFVNGSVLMDGELMSKSLGNTVPIRKAVKQYSADLIRTTVLYGASLLTDSDFNPTLVRWISRQMEKIKNITNRFGNSTSNLSDHKLQWIDRWILAILQERISSITRFIEMGEMRDALQQILHTLNLDIESYLQMKKSLSFNSESELTSRVMQIVIETIIKLLAPFAPHFCEELWESSGNQSYVSIASWPTIDKNFVDVQVRRAVDIVLKTIQDVKDIKGVLKSEPTKGTIILAPQWKYELYDLLNDLTNKDIPPKKLIPLVMQHEQFRSKGKEAVGLIDSYVKDSPQFTSQVDELSGFNELKPLVEIDTHLETIEITTTDDIQGVVYEKAKQARPGRPAIFLE